MINGYDALGQTSMHGPIPNAGGRINGAWRSPPMMARPRGATNTHGEGLPKAYAPCSPMP
jgi:hypothetical protein